MSKAVFLVAGRGSRLKGHTDEQPKCLLPIGGRPILEWSLEHMRRAGIDDITLVGGYRSERLSGYDTDLRINTHWAQTNMVRTLLCATDILAHSSTIVSYGDILYTPDILQALSEAPGDITITYDTKWLDLWAARFADPLEDAEQFETRDGLLQRIGGRAVHVEEIGGQYMGLLKFEPEGWRKVRDVLSGLSEASIDQLDMTSLLSKLLHQNISVHTVPVSGGWIEVDTPEDRDLAERIAAGQPGSCEHDWRASP